MFFLKTTSDVGQIKNYMKNGYSGSANQAIFNFDSDPKDRAGFKKFKDQIDGKEYSSFIYDNFKK